MTFAQALWVLEEVVAGFLLLSICNGKRFVFFFEDENDDEEEDELKSGFGLTFYLSFNSGKQRFFGDGNPWRLDYSVASEIFRLCGTTDFKNPFGNVIDWKYPVSHFVLQRFFTRMVRKMMVKRTNGATPSAARGTRAVPSSQLNRGLEVAF